MPVVCQIPHWKDRFSGFQVRLAHVASLVTKHVRAGGFSVFGSTSNSISSFHWLI